jgi:A/G-specific adenine glycosylase
MGKFIRECAWTVRHLFEQIFQRAGMSPGEQSVEIAKLPIEFVILLRTQAEDGMRRAQSANFSGQLANSPIRRDAFAVGNPEFPKGPGQLGIDVNRRDDQRPEEIAFARFINSDVGAEHLRIELFLITKSCRTEDLGFQNISDKIFQSAALKEDLRPLGVNQNIQFVLRRRIETVGLFEERKAPVAQNLPQFPGLFISQPGGVGAKPFGFGGISGRSHILPSMPESALHRNLLAWYAREARDLPWRQTQDPYAITVAEFMLQQTQVVTVLPYYTNWLASLPTVQALADAPETTVLSLWQGLGYYSRARNLHRLARVVLSEHGGQFPRDYTALRQLPGIGEYTANAILAFAYDLSAPVVDGNIARVLTRWFDYSGTIDSTAGKTWLRESAQALQPKKSSPRSWNSAVMELGATLCRAGKPDCLLCPVRPACRAEQPENLPRKAPRPATTYLEETRGLFRREGSILLVESPGPRWKGLWRLPEISPDPAETPLASCVYPITRYRITLNLVTRSWPHPLPTNWQAWPLQALPPMPAPDRRILQQILG